MSFLIPREDSRINHSISQRRLEEPRDIDGAPSTFQSIRGDNIGSPSSSVINFWPRWCRCHCFEHERYKKHEKVSFCKRCKNGFACPPQGVLSRFIIFFLICGTFWFVFWSLDEYMALDTISAIIVLEVTGLVFGIFCKMARMPALLAPLIIGIILKNIPHLDFFGGLERRDWIEPIREMALTIILTRAGIELSPKQIKKLGVMVPAAAFGPCLVEACACAAFFYAMFYKDGVDWKMCFVAGFALAAVSPAVVVPGMLSLKRRKYGEQEGVSTLMVAASSIDDVLAISGFYIFLNFLIPVAKGSEWKSYVGGILGILVGIVHGLVVGILLHFIPSKDVGRQLPNLRLVLLLLVNFSCIFLYQSDHLEWLSGAGSLGVLCTSFFASFGWRSAPHWKRSMKKVETSLAHIWTLCVPLLFGTIGNELDFEEISMHQGNVAKVAVVILASLVVRCVFMYFLMSIGTWTGKIKFNKKTRLFCALSWIPKATVQAALAPLVKEKFARCKQEVGSLKDQAQNVVVMAAFAILLTAPVGAVLINVCGPCLLTKAKELPEEFPNGEDPEEFKDVFLKMSVSAISDENPIGSADKIIMAPVHMSDGGSIEERPGFPQTSPRNNRVSYVDEPVDEPATGEQKALSK